MGKVNKADVGMTIITTHRLNELEAIIEKGIKGAQRATEAFKDNVLSVSAALVEIQAERLYAPDYRTFEDYIADKWLYCRTYIYRLMSIADVAQLDAPIFNVNQALALKKVPDHIQDTVIDFLNVIPGKVTAKKIETLSEVIQTAKLTGTFDGSTQLQKKLDAALTEELYERKLRQKAALNERNKPNFQFTGDLDSVMAYLLKNAQNVCFEVSVYEKAIILKKSL